MDLTSLLKASNAVAHEPDGESSFVTCWFPVCKALVGVLATLGLECGHIRFLMLPCVTLSSCVHQGILSAVLLPR